jgi:hypothetical protein
VIHSGSRRGGGDRWRFTSDNLRGEDLPGGFVTVEIFLEVALGVELLTAPRFSKGRSGGGPAQRSHRRASLRRLPRLNLFALFVGWEGENEAAGHGPRLLFSTTQVSDWSETQQDPTSRRHV